MFKRMIERASHYIVFVKIFRETIERNMGYVDKWKWNFDGR